MPLGNAGSNYLAATGKNQKNPGDPYEFGKHLIRGEVNIWAAKDTDFNSLLTQTLVLARLGDDKVLQFYQLDIHNLMMAFYMGQKDPNFRPVFSMMFYGWLGELRLTRAKQGSERDLMAAIGASLFPSGDANAYGDSFEQQKQDEGFMGLGKFLPKGGGGGPQVGSRIRGEAGY